MRSTMSIDLLCKSYHICLDGRTGMKFDPLTIQPLFSPDFIIPLVKCVLFALIISDTLVVDACNTVLR